MEARIVETKSETVREGDRIIVTTTKISNMDMVEAEKEMKAVNNGIEQINIKMLQLKSEINNREEVIKELNVNESNIAEFRKNAQAVQSVDSLEQMRTQMESLSGELDRHTVVKEDIDKVLNGTN
tara:strand:- start:484 stop:858 length:375 start_codon:yes stop_codon:yes gene_type:complete